MDLNVKFIDNVIIPYKIERKRKVDTAFDNDFSSLKSSKTRPNFFQDCKTSKTASTSLKLYEFNKQEIKDFKEKQIEIFDRKYSLNEKLDDEEDDSYSEEEEYQRIFSGKQELSLPDYHFKVLIDDNTPDDFKDCLIFALEIIQSKPVGHRLVEKLNNIFCNIVFMYSKEDEMRYFSEHHKVVISYQAAVDFSCGIDGKKLVDWPFISLAHELIHAYHFLYGKEKTLLPCSNTLVWTDQEEYATKMGSLDNPKRIRPKISENAIRQEHNLSLTFGHGDEGYMNDEKYRKGFFSEVQKFYSKINNQL